MEPILHKIESKNKSICKSNLLYHSKKFKSIKKNINAIICKLVGHRLNENPDAQ